MFDIFTTATLLGVLRVQPVESAYFLDNFYNREINFTSEEILFDKVVGQRRLAPFVSPVVQGRVMKKLGYQTLSFRPAYTKPKHIVDPNRQFTRLAGEAIGGDLSPGARWNAAVAENLREERDAIQRLWNWMAAMATIHGSVTVTGEDYPTQVVDFGRDAGLTNILAGGAQWDQVTADPLGDIKDMRTLAFQKGGAPITRLTFGLDAFDLFFANDDVQALFKGQEIGNVARTSDSSLSALGSPGAPYEYRGVLMGANGQGRVEIYTYDEQYEDEAGATQHIMDSYDVIGTGGAIQGTRCFGAIRDKRAGLAAMSLFPKMWDQEDPSVTYTMTQSAPLMVPGNPNNTFRMSVKN
jgi:hypothetical protein